MVDWEGSSCGLTAKSLAVLSAKDIGRAVALMFEEEDARRPLIVGLIEEPTRPTKSSERDAPSVAQSTPVEVTMDKKRLVLEAADEIVLRCGKASITLTKAGKVLISGAYVCTSASGTHRIRGGAVEIN